MFFGNPFKGFGGPPTPVFRGNSKIGSKTWIFCALFYKLMTSIFHIHSLQNMGYPLQHMGSFRSSLKNKQKKTWAMVMQGGAP